MYIYMDIHLFIASWFLLLVFTNDVNVAANPAGTRHTYARDELLRLKCIAYKGEVSPDSILSNPNYHELDCIRRNFVKRTRKRGRRGGVKLRMRRRPLNRTPLPSIIMGNVQSLRNKLDELQGNVQLQKDFKECGLLAFTETWFTEEDQETQVRIDGFGTPFRTDRDVDSTGKSQGGGVCLYVNERYCKSVTIRDRICTGDVELLSVSLRPHYLPREFPQLFITIVYIHPKANAASASSTVFDVIQKLQSISPDAPNFILGDFNHVKMNKTFPSFYQYVSCPTRRDRTLDLCYGSVKDAFKSLPLPPLGNSDHNCVHLVPKYKTVLKRQKTQTKEVKVWTNDSELSLQECFNCTDWDMFRQSCDNLDELTDVVCSYTTFCRDMLVTSRKVKVYPNNRPWVTKMVKSCINKKKAMFSKGTASELYLATREMKTEIKRAKLKYSNDVKQKMAANKLGSAWSSMKIIAGIHDATGTRNNITLSGFKSDTDLANGLNVFYNRFDTIDFKNETNKLSLQLLENEHFIVTNEDVEKALRNTKANKSPGPDQICGRLLRSCAKELSPVFQYIFTQSLKTQCVPAIWKDAIVVPVPKCSRPSSLNDLRPIALTSLPMKALEKMVRSEILKSTEQALDNLQFAYRSNRGVEDATLTLLHLLLKHLEGKGCHARLLFIDFSSAFNTILPNILTQRLVDYFNLSKNLAGWILDFLTNRTQRVRVNGTFSDQMCSSTGSPQGCVLSPLLFILYTNMCQSTFKNRFLLKYADDTVIVSLLEKNENGHGPVVNQFVQWCEESNLKLNTLKTKDMVIDFRKKKDMPEATIILGQSVEVVQSYKYLGTVIDSSLSFEENSETVCKRGHQRLFCLRKLSHFNIDRTMLTLFYRSFIESVLSFCLVAWFGSLALKNRNKVSQIIKWSSKLIGETQLSLEALYTRQVQRVASNIVSCDSHPLSEEFHLLPSGRRFQVPSCRTKRYRNSFVPSAAILLNKS